MHVEGQLSNCHRNLWICLLKCLQILQGAHGSFCVAFTSSSHGHKQIAGSLSLVIPTLSSSNGI